MIFRLDNNLIAFPDPGLAEADGLLAVGGDLSAARLMLGYHNGIFPWYSEGSPILWYSPHERFVLFANQLRINRSTRRALNSTKLDITFDKAFDFVIRECAEIERKEQDGTWITDDMQKAYINLHMLGHAHSVEVWENGKLVGGMYGVSVGSVFCGESMFSKVNNASKLAIIWLLENKNYKMIDCQIFSEHMERLGASSISRAEYVKILSSGSP